MAQSEKYVIIPDTQQRVYEGSVVMLFRLPNLKWILHYGVYSYNGRNRKGWYFTSIPSDTVMPVYNEDLVRLRVLDSPVPVPPGPGPHPPYPPGPIPPGPIPPAPIPIPFTPMDKMQVEHSMIVVDNLEARDKLSSDLLPNGKVVRVNDIDGQGTLEYYSWNSERSEWDLASLGYRYMTREEVEEAIGDSIVDIVWSNERGALVLTNNKGDKDSALLDGVTHDPIYTEEELTLRIPVYGKEDVVVTIPRDMYIRSIAYVENYHFDDPPHDAPAIVVTVSDGKGTQHEIAADASAMRNLYNGKETATTKVIINHENGDVEANVKLSSIANNPLKVDNEGFWVDLSGVVAKQDIEAGFLLVADGHGEFVYAGDGVKLEQTTAISDLADPRKRVVTANLIADAINAAITAYKAVVDPQLEDLTTRITYLESIAHFGPGDDGEILVTGGDKIRRSGYKIGTGDLDPSGSHTLATEETVANAIKWVQV